MKTLTTKECKAIVGAVTWEPVRPATNKEVKDK